MPNSGFLRFFDLQPAYPELRFKAYQDLAERGVHAIPGYLLIWLICLLSGQVWQQSFGMVLFGSVFILLSALFRLWQRQQLRQRPKSSYWALSYGLQTLSSGLFWGLYLSWQILSHPPAQAVVPLIAASGMAAASLTNLSPHLRICRSFSVLLLSPLIIALGLSDNLQLLRTSLLIITFLAFLLSIASRLNREYWASLETASQLQQQAQELTHLHQQAVTALQLRTQFLANMSHEIRTPMNGVLGLLELLRASELNHDQRQQLDIAYHSGQSLMALLNDILDLSRLEAGKVELEQLSFELAPLLNELHRLYQPKASQKHCQFYIDKTPSCPEWLQGDRLRLWQILNNLLSNALKFTERGEVRLRLNYQSPQLDLEICDTGVGIEAEQLERIFDNFTQADGSVTRRFGGSGLGLSIVRHLVDLMQGQIDVQSCPGQGSTFHLSLPLPIGQPPTAVSPISLPGRQPSLRILVVEDNQVNQLVTQGMLKHLGHQVQLAENGQQALDWLQQHPVDLILMDVQMPVMDGLTATRQLREQLNATPILGLTAHAMESDRLECLAAGMDDVLTKPLNLSLLAEKLDLWSPRPAIATGLTAGQA